MLTRKTLNLMGIKSWRDFAWINTFNYADMIVAEDETNKILSDMMEYIEDTVRDGNHEMYHQREFFYNATIKQYIQSLRQLTKLPFDLIDELIETMQKSMRDDIPKVTNIDLEMRVMRKNLPDILKEYFDNIVGEWKKIWN